MNIEQQQWKAETGWSLYGGGSLKTPAHLVLVFGGRAVLEQKERFDEVRKLYPTANLLLCSTAGEILGTGVTDHSAALTAVSPVTPTSDNASRTSSSLNGLMMASIFFISLIP